MAVLSHTSSGRVERHLARARRARAWAWPVRLALLACLAVAIWQEPRLSPWLHAQMQEAVAYAQGAIEGVPGPARQVAGLGGGGSSRDGGGLSGWLVEALRP